MIIIGVLLLTNIAVLAYFLSQKPGKHDGPHDRNERPGIADMLQKEVGFSDEQVAKYKVLKEAQHQAIRPMYDDMRKTKDSLFRLLSQTGPTDSLVNHITDAIAQKQKSLDLQTFTYFKKVREICTPEQLGKYDSLILRTFRKMGGKPQRQAESEKK